MAVTIDDIGTVAVISSGRMGRGIGAVAALAGYDVSLYVYGVADRAEYVRKPSSDRLLDLQAGNSYAVPVDLGGL